MSVMPLVAWVEIIMIPGALYHIYCEIFLERKSTRLFLISWAIYYVIQFGIYVVWDYTIFLQLFPVSRLFILSVVSFLAYDGTMAKKILMPILYCVFAVGIQIVANGLHTWIRQYHYVSLLKLRIIVMILLFTIVSLIDAQFRARQVVGIRIRYFMMLLFVPIGSVIIIQDLLHNIGGGRLSATPILILLIMNLMTISAYVMLSNEAVLRHKNTVYEQQIQLCQAHMEEKGSVLREYRKMVHDRKNEYYAMKELVEHATKEELVAYVEEKVLGICSQADAYDVAQTGNIAIDALINHKYAMAQSHHIAMQLELHMPNQIPYELADICILLGNTLDNAIEACCSVKKEQPKICLSMMYDKGNVIITLVNTYETVLLKSRSNQYITTKKDKKHHGIGIASVRKIVEKYAGHLTITDENNRFAVRVVLYQEEKNDI